jgi:vancomycin resistance protein YoaR
VSIAGHSMGGLTRDEAKATLDRLVADAQESPVTLVSGTETWPVTPDDVGTKIDVAGAVSEAMDVSRRSNIVVDLIRRLTLYFSGTDIPLQGSVDSPRMDEVLAGIAQEIDLPPVDPGLTIDGGKITAVEGQKGWVVDKDTLREQLKALLFTLHAKELPVPMVVKEPAMKAEDNRQAVIRAGTMISSSVSLTHGDKTWTLTSEQIAAYMDFTTEDQNGVAILVPFISATKMSPFFEDIADAVARKPVNATFKGDGQQAWVVPGVLGRALDREKTAEALTAAALKITGRTAKVAVKTTEPDRTTEEAEVMGIRDKLGSFTTEWEGTTDRQTNVKITTQYATNVILGPGDVYNFDKQIGPRTEARGYKMAPGITAGELEDQLGGGICQVSTTLFNAAFFAGLEILERKNHSIYIDHYPKGRDATVSAGSPNLRFRNDTKHHILVRGASNGISTTFVIYGTDEGRKVTYTTGEFYDLVDRTDVTIPDPSLGPGTTLIKTPGQPGKSIKVVRTVKAAGGSVIHKDTFLSTWRMIPRQIQVSSATTTTTAKPTSTTTTPPSTSTTTTTEPTATTGPVAD